MEVMRQKNFTSLTQIGLKNYNLDFEVFNLGIAGRSVSDYIGFSKDYLNALNPDHCIIQVRERDFNFGIDQTNIFSSTYINNGFVLNKRDLDNSGIQKIKNFKDNMGWFKPIFAYSALSFRRIDFDSKLKAFQTKLVDKNIENVNELKNKSAKNLRIKLIDWQIDQLKKAYGSKLSILYK